MEVEIDRLDQLDDALAGAPTVVMLDNFSTSDLAEAVRRSAGRVRLEASGGVTLETVRAIAATGVDGVSVGALTHSAPVLDLGFGRGGLSGAGRNRARPVGFDSFRTLQESRHGAFASRPARPADRQRLRRRGPTPTSPPTPARRPRAADPNQREQGEAGNRNQNFTPHLRTQDR